MRQLRLVNHGSETRTIDVTSYAEIVLNAQAADEAHPAFQKLFIETEFIAEEASIIARRRPRSAGQETLMAVHTIAAPGDKDGNVQFDTSRHSFLGRNRSTLRPDGATAETLAGNVGAVLDPVFALRCRVELAPDEAVTLSFTTSVAANRSQAMTLADQYRDSRGTHRVFELAWAYAQAESRHGNIDGPKVHLYQRLGSALLYPDAALRADPAMIARNTMAQPALWRYGISGDLPIMTCRLTETEQMELVRELIGAQRFLIAHGLYCDLLLVNDYPGSYIDALQDQLQTLINDAQLSERRHGAIHLLRGSQLTAEDQHLIAAVSACAFAGDGGTLSQQLDARAGHRQTAKTPTPNRLRSIDEPSPYVQIDADAGAKLESAFAQLEFANSYGGFVDDGRAYVINRSDDRRTPAPWSNVIANERCGTLLTESGGGYTWFMNSRENKLTTWSNDAVVDPPSEVIYLRDEESGHIWTPLPALETRHGRFRVQHGCGYSHYHHVSHGLAQDVYVTVASDDPVKLVRIRVTNHSPATRRLSLTYFAEAVLGVGRERSSLMLVSERDAASGALFMRNPYSVDFANQVVFLKVVDATQSVTADRRSFIGRNGSLRSPLALATHPSNLPADADPIEVGLDGRVGAALDPCMAVQSNAEIREGATAELFVLFGAGSDVAETRALLEKYSHRQAVTAAIDEASQRWRNMLSTVQVQTPNRGMDVLVNSWLVYQTLSCRVWGRSAFYQSGGAYGFRDQLQDVMALVYTRPDLTRQHILRAAARQFWEGDVQHWWHPPAGKGTRTRFSDDFLFLPFVTDFYLRVTGDHAILDEQVSFVASQPLHEDEQERYEQPHVSDQRASIYEHCVKALEHGWRYGRQGLPLMGCGDWNDGMNKVGEGGQGESVWVAMFQVVVFEQFTEWMRRRGDEQNRQRFERKAHELREAIETHAWDGRWYHRAYFDDGTPMGSHKNDECQIDSLSQSWAVMAGLNAERARAAVDAAVDRLVVDDAKLILLFTPPFNHSEQDPGYIKGYLPGIRENGGQYTHAATWLIEAASRLGDGKLAMRLFDILNPIHHALTEQDAQRYRVEPYVVTADVYSVQPHVGLGGWSWYTGSASWTYRVALEHLLGLRVEVDRVRIDPCVPDDWQEFSISLRRGATSWHIHLRRRAYDSQSGPFEMHLHEDGQEHHIDAYFASKPLTN